MSEPLLSVVGLSTHFDTRAGVAKAVDDVSFALGRGEVLGLVGESGSGKSMTAYSILGLVDPPGHRLVCAREDLVQAGRRHLDLRATFECLARRQAAVRKRRPRAEPEVAARAEQEDQDERAPHRISRCGR